MNRTDPHARPRAMTPLAWAALAAGVLGVLIAIVWLGATNDGDGDPLVENPGAVLVAMISLLTSVLALVLPQLLAVKKQVQNSHSTNLRDDIDDKHDTVRGDIRRLTRIALKTQSDVAWLMRQQAETDRRVDDIEDTLNPKERPQ